MLVIPDEPSLGISREGRLPCSREPKEEGCASISTLVRRAVHGGHAAIRQDSLQDSENRLFDLAGILGTGDQDATPLEVDSDSSGASGLMSVRDRLELGRMQDRPNFAD